MTAVQNRPEIGQSRRRKEDEHLITGRTTWVDNMNLPGMLHLAVLRSPMAHATITSIDTTEAKGRPGVVAVFTGQAFAEPPGHLPCAWPPSPPADPPATVRLRTSAPRPRRVATLRAASPTRHMAPPRVTNRDPPASEVAATPS